MVRKTKKGDKKDSKEAGPSNLVTAKTSPRVSKRTLMINTTSRSKTSTITTSRVIQAGKYSFDQSHFKKGEIPGLRSTHRFPKAKPIIFKGKLVGWPERYGPYGTQLDPSRPPSPPPPTPVPLDVFPEPPRFPWNKLKRRQGNRNDTQQRRSLFTKYGIHTTDPFADLTIDTSIGLCGVEKEFRISPIFQTKQYQYRFMWITLTFGFSLGIPIFLVLITYSLVPEFREAVIKLFFFNFTITLILFGILVSLFVVMSWFAAFFRYRPWRTIYLICATILKSILTLGVAILTDVIYLMAVIDNDRSKLAQKANVNVEAFNYFLQKRQSHSFWVMLALPYTVFLHLIVVLTMKFTQLNVYNIEVKIYVYCALWILFCVHGIILVLSNDLFKGPPEYDFLQTFLCFVFTYARTIMRINIFASLYQGKLCAITEKEFVYGINRVAH